MSSRADLVLVTSRSFGSGSDDPAPRLRAAGLEVVKAGPDHDSAEVAAALPAARAWIAGTAPITARHLAAAPRLRVIARYGVGIDSVDLAAAAAREIVVTNTPGANSEAVAEHALALVLATIRQVVAGDHATREGRWRTPPGRELGALTVGVIGFGQVGRGLTRRLVEGFSTRVLVHDPYLPAADVEACGARRVDLDALLAASDVVSLHAPAGSGIRFDAPTLARMKPDAVLINTARGELVDEPALAAALSDGRLAGAAVDVLATEPPGASPLFAAPHCIVTPHAAAQTLEAIDRMGAMASADVLRVLAGDSPLHPVAAR
ncbi:MAG: phosphoglycerate dehydrogenase [Actinobacteria bacterium]|nr:phosphoglycerate dehydrogenase [Actinomycetota bacterium]